jgi:hypothetical protein
MPEARSAQPAPEEGFAAAPDQHGGEEVDALPVLVEEPVAVGVQRPARALSRDRVAAAAGLPAVQAAAVAAGSFVAGAAVARLVHRRRREPPAARRRGRRASRSGGQRRPAGEQLQIVGSRSLLVDVHLLGLPLTDR